MPDPSIEFVRVSDEVKPRREYSIVASTFDESIHTEVKGSPAAGPDGVPLPPKYTPEALSRTESGQKADTPKEKP